MKARSRAEVVLSLGMLALGVGVAAGTAMLPSEGGYAGIGPDFVPRVVAAGLILLGVWLSYEAFSGGWRGAPSDEARERGEHPFHLPSFAWISIGLFGHLALIGSGGFVLAGAALFACVARGFGSARPARDIAIGLVLAVGVFSFFVKVLNVGLPAGWLAPLLGAAGI